MNKISPNVSFNIASSSKGGENNDKKTISNDLIALQNAPNKKQVSENIKRENFPSSQKEIVSTLKKYQELQSATKGNHKKRQSAPKDQYKNPNVSFKEAPFHNKTNQKLRDTLHMAIPPNLDSSVPVFDDSLSDSQIDFALFEPK